MTARIFILLLVLLLSPVLSQASGDAITSGQDLFEQGEYGRALDIFTTALEQDRANSELYYWIGRAHLAERNPDAAIEALEQSVTLDPSRPEPRLRLASAYEMRERQDDAVAQYQAVLDMDDLPRALQEDASKRMRYAIATGHAQRGEVGRALELFEGLSEDYPDDPLIIYSKAIAYLLSNRMADARAAFETVIAIDPEYINAYLNLATVDEREGRLQEAVNNLRRVIELEPDSSAAGRAEVRLQLIEGHLMSQSGNFRAAVEAFNTVLELDPRNRVALVELAGLYRQLDELQNELDLHLDIIEYYPDDDRAHMRLAQLYLLDDNVAGAYEQLEWIIARGEQGRFYNQADTLLSRLRATAPGRRFERERLMAMVETLQAQVEEDPDDIEAWRELGLIYFRGNAHQLAIDAFEEVRRLDPADSQSREGLAQLYDHLGRFRESVREYAYLVAMETDIDAASRLVSMLRLVNAKHLYSVGRHELALSDLHDILDQDSENQIALFYLGLIYAEEDEMLKAVDAYREVVRIIPEHVGARMNLALSYERLNREEDAIDEYRKILNSDPPPQIAERARQQLESAQQRIRGITATAGYQMSYDDNMNLSENATLDDFRSDLSLNLAYQYKMQNDIRWRFLLNPTYTNYHKNQLDYLNNSITASASLMPGRYTLVGGYTHRVSDSLITDNRVSRMHTFFAEGTSRYRVPSLLRPFSGRRIRSNVSMSLSYNQFEAKTNDAFSSYTTTAGLSLSQQVSDITRVRLGYNWVRNENMELLGNDYAYVSHGINFGLDRFTSWGSVNLGYGYTQLDYSNPDSFTQFTRFRKNSRHNISLGANYSLRRNIRLFTNVSWTDNQSNLPVGFVLDPEDVIQGLQSPSLSNYQRLMVTTGINARF